MPSISRRNLPPQRRIFPCVFFFAVPGGILVLLVLCWLLVLQDRSATLGLGSMISDTNALETRHNNPVSRKHVRDPTTLVKQKPRPVIVPADFRGQQLLLSEADPIYKWGSWDEAPIVIESHKLLFFSIPKCGCTVWKQLFRRMYGFQNWNVHNDYLPHHPQSNGLNYLYHYKPEEAERMLTDPSWTRAIFFRDPKERLLSAYLDKVLHNQGKYVRVHCCQGSLSLKMLLKCQIPAEKITDPLVPFADFLEKVVPYCSDPHWRAQAYRIPEKYWSYINFVGHMDHIEQDAKALLQRIGAWDDYGTFGWEWGAVFAGAASVAHATDARRKVSAYYTPWNLIQVAERLHKIDYEHPVVSMSKGHVQ